jgi:hypothetical protein
MMEVARAPDLCPHCGAPAAPMLIVAHIQATVAAYYRIDVRYMKSAQRGFDVSHPRQVAMYLAAELTEKSLPSIGRCFNRDHTTVIYAIRAVRARMAADPELAMDVGYLKGRLAPNPQDIHSQKEPESVNFPPVAGIEQTMKTQAESMAA